MYSRKYIVFSCVIWEVCTKLIKTFVYKFFSMHTEIIKSNLLHILISFYENVHNDNLYDENNLYL